MLSEKGEQATMFSLVLSGGALSLLQPTFRKISQNVILQEARALNYS